MIEATGSLAKSLLAEIWRALATQTEDGVPVRSTYRATYRFVLEE